MSDPSKYKRLSSNYFLKLCNFLQRAQTGRQRTDFHSHQCHQCHQSNVIDSNLILPVVCSYIILILRWRSQRSRQSFLLASLCRLWVLPLKITELALILTSFKIYFKLVFSGNFQISRPRSNSLLKTTVKLIHVGENS